MDDRLFEFTEFVGRWDSLIDSLIVDLEYESPSGDKFRAALLEAETIASESEAASAGDTPALRKTEFQVELGHSLRADPSNEVCREALALLTNAQLAKPCSKARGPEMPKDRDRKIEEAIVRAESAQQAALNALTMAQVLGSVLESTLAMLQAKEVVAPDDLGQIFLGAAAAIDELKPSNENERGAQQAMRATVVHIAKRFRIEIPPPGQTGMPRTH